MPVELVQGLRFAFRNWRRNWKDLSVRQTAKVTYPDPHIPDEDESTLLHTHLTEGEILTGLPLDADGEVPAAGHKGVNWPSRGDLYRRRSF